MLSEACISTPVGNVKLIISSLDGYQMILKLIHLSCLNKATKSFCKKINIKNYVLMHLIMHIKILI